MTYVYLTDTTCAAATTLQGLGATVAYTFPNHVLWMLTGSNPFGGKSTVDSTGLRASVLLPNPL